MEAKTAKSRVTLAAQTDLKLDKMIAELEKTLRTPGVTMVPDVMTQPLRASIAEFNAVKTACGLIAAGLTPPGGFEVPTAAVTKRGIEMVEIDTPRPDNLCKTSDS